MLAGTLLGRRPKALLWLLVCGVLALAFMTHHAGAAHAQAPALKFLAADDPAYHYIGRHQRGPEVLWTWAGSGLRVGYSGAPNLRLRLYAFNASEESSNGMTRVLYYRVDGGGWKRITIGSGADEDFTLSTPADNKPHTLDILKVSEGRVTFKGLWISEAGTLRYVGGLGTPIEFVGDSLTVGHKALGLGSFEVPFSHDVRVGFAWRAAEMLGAEPRLTAVTGRGVVKNFGENPDPTRTMLALYGKLHRNEGAPYDFNWQPEFVVINLGTNDMTGPVPTAPDAFQAAYAQLLAAVRAGNPGAFIVAMSPFGLKNGRQRAFNAQIQAAVSARQTAGDKRTVFIDTAGWLGPGSFTDGVHLNSSGHARAAALLASSLRRLRTLKP
jgi:lysophospholipase L1-like esterase